MTTREGQKQHHHVTIKPLQRQVAEHKDVLKLVVQLNTTVASIKPQVQELLERFKKYSDIWTQVMNGVLFDITLPGIIRAYAFL